MTSLPRLPHTLLLTLSAAALLAGCTKTFDNKEMQDKIQKDAAAQGIKLASVTCPAGQPMKEGAKFDCTCTDTKGTTGTIQVDVPNSHGRFEWKLQSKFMRMNVVGDSLEANLSKKLNQVVDVVCPQDNILVKKGVSFSCDVKVGSKTEKITLTAKADDGSDWDEKITSK